MDLPELIRRWRGRPTAPRRSRLLDAPCPTCGHPWAEHAGSGLDADRAGTCGECVYEVEHGEAEPGHGCTSPVPEALRDRS